MKFIGRTGETFEVKAIDSSNMRDIQDSENSDLTVIWFLEDGSEIEIDGILYYFKKNEILCLTEFHKLKLRYVDNAKVLRWNKHFYCVLNHDSEVGCKGFLFYGANDLPIIQAKDEDIKTFRTVWAMLEQEMVSRDSLQEEMLQMMLKRILILCARIYKQQSGFKNIDSGNSDIIREYNFLVEQHFREKHTVSEYAELLFKSPKTLSNLFKKVGDKSPLQFIQDRKMLEARRLLVHTDKSVSEIGYEIGFTDVQSFSRFFKKQEGKSPQEYRTAA